MTPGVYTKAEGLELKTSILGYCVFLKIRVRQKYTAAEEEISPTGAGRLRDARMAMRAFVP